MGCLNINKSKIIAERPTSYSDRALQSQNIQVDFKKKIPYVRHLLRNGPTSKQR